MNPMRRWADLLTETLDDWNTGVWVHYSDQEMLSINPKPWHQDPLGLYCFPETFPPYTHMWPNRRYKFRLTLKPATRILDLARITDATLDGLLQVTGAAADFAATNAQYPLQGHNENPLDHHKERVHRAWASMRNAMILAPGGGGRAGWNKHIRALGWDAIFDDTKAIHSAEVQLLILNPRVIAGVDRQRQGNSGFAAIQAVLADLGALCARFGTVSVDGPKKTHDGHWHHKDSPKLLMAEIKVTAAADNYATLAVRHDASDPTYKGWINVSLRWSRPSLGYGVGARYDLHKRQWGDGHGGRNDLDRLGDDLARIFAPEKVG
jgi:hypothetical protein